MIRLNWRNGCFVGTKRANLYSAGHISRISLTPRKKKKRGFKTKQKTSFHSSFCFICGRCTNINPQNTSPTAPASYPSIPTFTPTNWLNRWCFRIFSGIDRFWRGTWKCIRLNKISADMSRKYVQLKAFYENFKEKTFSWECFPRHVSKKLVRMEEFFCRLCRNPVQLDVLSHPL